MGVRVGVARAVGMEMLVRMFMAVRAGAVMLVVVLVFAAAAGVVPVIVPVFAAAAGVVVAVDMAVGPRAAEQPADFVGRELEKIVSAIPAVKPTTIG